MLLYFKLGKELGEEYTKGGSKNDKMIARRIYQSFANIYLQIPYNKIWKLRHFRDMKIKDTEEIAHN